MSIKSKYLKSMTSIDVMSPVIFFAIAFAMTHLIVLPFKAFFITGDLRDKAVRATTWNLLALVYTAAVLFLFGVETESAFWGVIRFLPALIIFAFSIGVWLYIMVRATKKFMLIDVAVFTILAFAAS